MIQVEWILVLQEDKYGSRVACFKSGLSGAVCGVEAKLYLRSFDMVFVPLLEAEHYYLLVFDMKHQDICVIDNIAEKRSPVKVVDNEDYERKSTPYKVVRIFFRLSKESTNYSCFLEKCFDTTHYCRKIFVDYLCLVKHPKAGAMEGCRIRRLDLPWATHKNSVDCGVYLMRHMETYMGVQVAFKCGFSLNGKRKQAQVDALRKRYAANILLSATNIYKNRVCDGALSM